MDEKQKMEAINISQEKTAEAWKLSMLELIEGGCLLNGD